MNLVAVLSILSLAVAHGPQGEHAPKSPPQGLNWQKWHMAEEHQLEEFDAKTFFKIHDLRGVGRWNAQDILNMYGLALDVVVGDGSGMGTHDHKDEAITEEQRQKVVSTILELMDTDKDGEVDQNEWLAFSEAGDLPDFGLGQGHHLDFESEYEEHHWNKYHKDQDPEVLVKHKEDIEHELLHHEHEIEETHDKHPEVRKISSNFISPINIDQLPYKYRNQN